MRVDALDGHAHTRLDRHYAPAVRLARLLLAGDAIADRSGQVSAQAFMVDMNRLFESYVEDRVRAALRGRLAVRGQYGTHLDGERHVFMKPDLVFFDGRRQVYVADAKYKLSGTGIGINADYYQALAYATALSLPEALLVYCHDDGEAPPTEITVRGSRVRLLTYRLDLSGGPDDLERRMTALARFMSDRADIRSAVSLTS
jgi:5-methylcytosine-specific restriction enzyme subunit McrC